MRAATQTKGRDPTCRLTQGQSTDTGPTLTTLDLRNWNSISRSTALEVDTLTTWPSKWRPAEMVVGWVGWLGGWVGRSVGRSVGWLVDWSVGWLVDWLIG